MEKQDLLEMAKKANLKINIVVDVATEKYYIEVRGISTNINRGPYSSLEDAMSELNTERGSYLQELIEEAVEKEYRIVKIVNSTLEELNENDELSINPKKTLSTMNKEEITKSVDKLINDVWRFIYDYIIDYYYENGISKTFGLTIGDTHFSLSLEQNEDAEIYINFGTDDYYSLCVEDNITEVEVRSYIEYYVYKKLLKGIGNK